MNATVTFFKPDDRLAKLMAQPGGRSVADAVKAAEKRIHNLRGYNLAALQPRLLRLTELAALGLAGDGEGEGELEDIYGLADEIATLASLAGLEQMYEAAYRLCDLTEVFRTSGRTSWAAVEVYADSLRLLSADPLDEAEARSILEALQRVSALFTAMSET
jgi:hypothetical protein